MPGWNAVQAAARRKPGSSASSSNGKYAGRYSGGAVFGGFTLVAGLWLAAAILHRRFLRAAVRVTAETSTIYPDAQP
jgi:hypothetical protein